MSHKKLFWIPLLCIILFILLNSNLSWAEGFLGTIRDSGYRTAIGVCENNNQKVKFSSGTFNLDHGKAYSLISQTAPGSLRLRVIFKWVDGFIQPYLSPDALPTQKTFGGFLLVALLKTLFILFIVFLLWKLINIGMAFLSKQTELLKSKYPDFEQNLIKYLDTTKKILHSMLFIIAILFAFEVWGIKVFLFISRYSQLINSVIRIPLILVFAMVLLQISRFVIFRLEGIIGKRMNSRPGASEIETQKQIKTVGEIIYKTIYVIIFIMSLMMIMKEFGFDIKPVLASAGIVGLAIGFGAQNLVRDVISGLFMIIENQIRVGDVAILNGTGGLVEAVNLRTTVLRGLDGALHVFPNGTITNLSNLTHNFSCYVFDIGVAYKEDIDRVVTVLQKISDEIMADPQYSAEILEPLEIMGLDKFGDSAINIKARIKTKPIKQWMVGREFNRRIKSRFDQENIEIPFPHRTIYFGEVSKPFDVNVLQDKENEQAIKRLIKEVLSEDLQDKHKDTQ